MIERIGLKFHCKRTASEIPFQLFLMTEQGLGCLYLCLITDSSRTLNHPLPETWEQHAGEKIRFTVCATTGEYASVFAPFHQAMKETYSHVIKIERIQNELCYRQYLLQRQDFRKRLNSDTERRLYHGCPQKSADSIIKTYFNRSYRGQNGMIAFVFQLSPCNMYQ